MVFCGSMENCHCTRPKHNIPLTFSFSTGQKHGGKTIKRIVIYSEMFTDAFKEHHLEAIGCGLVVLNMHRNTTVTNPREITNETENRRHFIRDSRVRVIEI